MTASRPTIAAIRFGYGLRPGEAPPAGAADLLDQLKRPGPDEPDIAGLPAEARAAAFMDYLQMRKRRRTDTSLTPEVQARAAVLRGQFAEDVAARIRAPIVSRRGFFERLAWFWGDHFTVNGKNFLGRAFVARFEAEAIRPHVATSFRQMLREAVTHPGMIAYLDQQESFGPASRDGRRKGKGLNENLAREIIELHTLGVGGPYSQRDVREFAELLTGLGIRRRTGEALYRRKRAEPGPETVLGRTYAEDGDGVDQIEAALDDLADHPATARHLSRKLVVHFVSDQPDPALVAHVEAAWLRSGGDLPTVYAALLERPESWDSFGAKVKQPFDFIVSSVRAAGFPDDRLAPFLRRAGGVSLCAALEEMNQPVWGAPGPDGWAEEAEAWITAQGMAARLNWATVLARHIAPYQTADGFLRDALADAAGDELKSAVRQAPETWERLALILAAPEFNRR